MEQRQQQSAQTLAAIDAAISPVLAGFTAAQSSLAELLASGMGRAQVQAGIRSIVSGLRSDAVGWAHVAIPRAFNEGLQSTGVIMAPARRHDTASGALADAAASDLSHAASSMGATAIRDLARQTRRKALASALANTRLGERVVLRGDEDGREIKVLDSSQRAWDPAAYLRMALSWHLHHAKNTGIIYAGAALGSPGVLVSDGSSPTSDEPCLRANGQRWSLAYASENTLQHPRCVRRLFPLAPGDSGKLDRG